MYKPCQLCLNTININRINVVPAAATLLSTSVYDMNSASSFVKFALIPSYLHNRKEDGDSGACGADMMKTVKMISRYSEMCACVVRRKPALCCLRPLRSPRSLSETTQVEQELK